MRKCRLYLQAKQGLSRPPSGTCAAGVRNSIARMSTIAFNRPGRVEAFYRLRRDSSGNQSGRAIMTRRPIQIDRRRDADQETEQAILRVQRTLCLMNAPHSYRLYDAATLLRQAALSPAAADESSRPERDRDNGDEGHGAVAAKPGMPRS
jgi:hypothetical protein